MATWLDPNDPAVRAQLAALNPSGTSLFAPTGQTPLGNLDPFVIGGQNLLNENPAFLEAQAQGKKQRSDAASTWIEQLKNLLLGYGSKSLASSTLGSASREAEKYLGYAPAVDPFLGQLEGAEDPDTSFSTLAQLAKQARTQRYDSREGYNKRNLFYSGAYVKQQGEDSYADQLAHSNAAKQLQEALSSLGANFVNQINTANQGDVSAAQTAYGQDLDRALKYGYTGAPVAPPPNPSGAAAKPPPSAAGAAAKPNPSGNFLATPAPGASLAAAQKAYQQAAQPRYAPAKPKPPTKTKVKRIGP